MPGELMVEEYKSLRRELLQLAGSISRWQMVGYLFAGVGIALVTGPVLSMVYRAGAFGTDVGAVMIPALLAVAGCIFGIIHDITSIHRIAAYIQAFHEGQDTGALWETRLEAVRAAEIVVPLRPYMTPILSLLWIGMLCSAAAPIPALIRLLGERQYHGLPVGFWEWVGALWLWALPVVWLVFWQFARVQGPDAEGLSQESLQAQTGQAGRLGGCRGR